MFGPNSFFSFSFMSSVHPGTALGLIRFFSASCFSSLIHKMLLISLLLWRHADYFNSLFKKVAVAATTNVELGNKELSQAIQRNSRGRLVYQSTKKMASGPKCPITGKTIQGVCRPLVYFIIQGIFCRGKTNCGVYACELQGGCDSC
ncbi:unnamed protein product [Camellia sinensis]